MFSTRRRPNSEISTLKDRRKKIEQMKVKLHKPINGEEPLTPMINYE